MKSQADPAGKTIAELTLALAERIDDVMPGVVGHELLAELYLAACEEKRRRNSKSKKATQE